MKITTFNPLIFTKDAKPLIELFEALGFERTHTKEGINSEATTNFRMKDANGFHVDITQTERTPGDRCSIRMNVDSYEEAMAILQEHGFQYYEGTSDVETASSTVAIMKSPSGFSINVSEHKK